MRNRYAADPDLIRARKRKSMAAWRAANPDVARARSRASHARRRAQVNAKMREMNAARLFWARAQKLRGISARQLACLWRQQRGLCALTGRRMGRDAQIDHIIPRARGGTDELSNLQWLCAEANLAKRNLTDAEFHTLCTDVVRWLGERIAMVEAMEAIHVAA